MFVQRMVKHLRCDDIIVDPQPPFGLLVLEKVRYGWVP